MTHMTETTFPTPPDTLSDLLTMALDDAEHIEQDERYTFRMYDWHAPLGGRCYVCMAGAIMARTLGTDPMTAANPVDYPYRWRRALFAVEGMRTGRLVAAYHFLMDCVVVDDPVTSTILNRLGEQIDHAFDDVMGRAPWSVYREVAEALQEAGL